MTIEARPRRDGEHFALCAEFDLALGDIEVERTSFDARFEQGAIRAEQRTRIDRQIASAVDRVLDLFVGQARGAAHQSATESMRVFAARPINTHVDEQT